MEYSEAQIEALFPINSQSSSNDKAVILNGIELVKKIKTDYAYVEIGSFLGGSLAPCLMDSRCKLVLSIDERECKLNDERGAKFDYAGITNKTMIDNLEKYGINTANLQTFDGSIDTFKGSPATFDLAFIDGEHTDFACFRDFLWVMPMMKSDAIVMFHDSTLIYKALKLIQLYLRKSGLQFKFFKKTDSDMSCILLGEFSKADASMAFGAEQNPEEFYDIAETAIINYLISNRVVVQFNAKVIPQKTFPAF